MKKSEKKSKTGVNVLIVEDSKTQALSLKLILEEAGYDCRISWNGHEALTELKKKKADIILSDIKMPEMDGFELCRITKLDPAFKHIPVILLTTLVDIEDVIIGLNVRADYYVTKPFSPNFILEKIESLVKNNHKQNWFEKSGQLEISNKGKKHLIDSSRGEILNYLFSTYENALSQNIELTQTKETLEEVNEKLETNLEELHKSEERFRSLVKTIPDIVYRVNSSGKFTYLNDAIFKLGYSPEELIGKHFSHIILPADVSNISRDSALKKYNNRKTGDGKSPKLFDERRSGERKTTGLEVRLLVKNPDKETPGYVEMIGGDVLMVEVNSSGTYQINPFSKDRNFIGTVGVIRDITHRKRLEKDLWESNQNLEKKVDARTAEQMEINRKLMFQIKERKKAEKSLKENEEKFRTITENSADAIFITDKSGLYQYVNNSACEMLGYTKEELIGMTIIDISIPEKIDSTQRLFKELLDRGKIFVEIELKKKDGTIVPIDLNAVVLPNSLVYGSCRDISARKEAEMEKKKMEDQLKHSQKMEAVGTLAGGIAHDFNNILSLIHGYTELSIDKLNDKEPVRENLEQVLTASNRAKELVQQILLFSRKSEQVKKLLQFKDILDETMTLLRSTIPTTIKFSTEFMEGLKPIMGNPTQIHQVIINLCTNAAHAMREKGGTLELSLSEIKLGSRLNQFKQLPPGTYQKLSVQDSGCGIQPGIIERIFEPYFTTKGEGVGTGMGLATAHGIVKDHNGDITVYSEPDRGTTFNVYIPVFEKESRTANTVEPDNLEIVKGKGEHVLLVDDEKALLELVQQMLTMLGYKVSARVNSLEALDHFASNPDTFDLLITDMNMPAMSGVELARGIHAVKANLPVILCTGFSERINEKNYRKHGISEFIMKPVLMNTLSQTIQKVLSNGEQGSKKKKNEG